MKDKRVKRGFFNDTVEGGPVDNCFAVRWIVADPTRVGPLLFMRGQEVNLLKYVMCDADALHIELDF